MKVKITNTWSIPKHLNVKVGDILEVKEVIEEDGFVGADISVYLPNGGDMLLWIDEYLPLEETE